MNKKFIISLILISLLLSVQAAKVQEQKSKTKNVDTEKSEKNVEKSEKNIEKEEQAKDLKTEKVKKVKNEAPADKPAKEDKPVKGDKVKQDIPSKEAKQENVQEKEQPKENKQDKAAKKSEKEATESKQETIKEPKQAKAPKEEKTVKADKVKQEISTKEVKEKKTNEAQQENKQQRVPSESKQEKTAKKAEKEATESKQETIKEPKQAKAPKEPKEIKPIKQEKAPKVDAEEEVTKELKVKSPKEVKEKAPKQEEQKVKIPKEPKEPKEPKVKEEKVVVPRNFTTEVIGKVSKFIFWNGVSDATYLQSYKLAGLKKSHCLVNEYQKVSTISSAAKNLCLINQYNAALENEWQNWATNSTTETGKFRFFNNGTACEQEYNWKLSELNNTAVENGSFIYSNSSNGIGYTCTISGLLNTNQTSSWQSTTTYTMHIAGDKRGEVYNKTSSSEIAHNQNKTESTSHQEYVEDTVYLSLNQAPQAGQNFTVRSTKGENKINQGQSVVTIVFNGNSTINENKWNKSKTILEFVESYPEGQRFGSEHSKVKSDTTLISAQGIVLQDSGVTSERSRQYYKQTFGTNANNVDYTDIGNDRKWKNSSLRPEKNVDTPANWNVTGTFTAPVAPVKNFQNKKIDL